MEIKITGTPDELRKLVLGNSNKRSQNLLSTSIGIDSSKLSKQAEKLRDVIRKQSEKLKG